MKLLKFIFSFYCIFQTEEIFAQTTHDRTIYSGAPYSSTVPNSNNSYSNNYQPVEPQTNPGAWYPPTEYRDPYYDSPGYTGNPYADGGGGGGDPMSFYSPYTAGGGGSGGSVGKLIVQNVRFTLKPAKGKEDACPVLLQATDEARLDKDLKPTFEHEGDVALTWIAHSFKLLSRNPQTVTFEAFLNKEFENCEAVARMSMKNEQDIPPEYSYINLHFFNKKLHVMLDMARLPPPLQGKLIVADVENEQRPFWKWIETRSPLLSRAEKPTKTQNPRTAMSR